MTRPTRPHAAPWLGRWLSCVGFAAHTRTEASTPHGVRDEMTRPPGVRGFRAAGRRGSARDQQALGEGPGTIEPLRLAVEPGALGDLDRLALGELVRALGPNALA